LIGGGVTVILLIPRYNNNISKFGRYLAKMIQALDFLSRITFCIHQVDDQHFGLVSQIDSYKT
jgi:hypothetical protein